MDDLSKLSDEQLKSLAGLSSAQPSGSGDLSHYSDEELLRAVIGQETPKQGFGEAILNNVVVPVGRFVDQYTGAPTRASIGALQSGANPISAFTKQFGEAPELAPTGKELAQRAGLGETTLSQVLPDLYSESGDEWLKFKKGGLLDPTASGAAGLGLDLASDWTNLIPGTLAAKALAGGAAKGAGTAAKVGAKAAAGAADLATGTRAASKVVGGAGQILDSAKSIARSALSPKQAEDFARTLEIAKRYGIDPSILSSEAEFGKSSIIPRIEKVIAEGPAGEKYLKRHEEGLGQISGALEKEVGKVSGGVKLSEPEAGKLIRDGFQESTKKFFDSKDITFNKVQKYAPRLMLDKEAKAALDSTLSGVEKYAKGLTKRGITDSSRQQGKQLIRAVEAARSGNGSFKQTVEAMQEIGKAAFGKSAKSMAEVTPDVEKLRDIYFKMNEGLIDTVRNHVNPEFADELVANNQAMKEFFSNKSSVYPAIGNKSLSDEGVFKNLILSGDTKKIAALKEILPPEQVSNLKGAFLESVMKRGDDGKVSFAKLASALESKKNQVSALFDAHEIEVLNDLVQLGKKQGSPIMSTSGTGASNSINNFLKSGARALVGEQSLEALKGRARSASLPAQKSTSSMLRGPVERRLKAAQSVSPSRYSEDSKRRKRLKALGE